MKLTSTIGELPTGTVDNEEAAETNVTKSQMLPPGKANNEETSIIVNQTDL